MPSARLGYQRSKFSVDAHAETGRRNGGSRFEAKAHQYRIAASGELLRLAFLREELDACNAHLSSTAAIRNVLEIRTRLRIGECRHIRFDYLPRRSVFTDFAGINPDGARAKIFNCRHVVGDEQDGAPAAAESFHGRQAFLLKGRVADG